MKNLFCLLIMTLPGVVVCAQKVHFLYFETDNAQPFYLKMDDKVYSSSSAGGFLLPNLIDTTYNLSIGFPSTNTEAKFKLSVDGKDYGYAIKTFEFGLGLFDMQSLSVTKPQADTWKSNVTYQYRSNDFTSLLAKASNDTSLFYVPIVMKEEVAVQKKEPITEDKKAETKTENIPDTVGARFDSALVKRPEGVETGAVATIPVVKQEEKTTTPYVFPGALVINATSNKDIGVKVEDSITKSEPANTAVLPVITDSLSQNIPKTIDSATVIQIADTVVIAKLDSIPLKSEANVEYIRSKVKRHSESSTSEGFGLVFFDNYEGGSDTISLIIPNPKVSFKEADTTQFEDGLLEIKKDTVLEAAKVPKSKCSATASDNDFYKLRKNMAAKQSDDEMIAEAKKAFRAKCYSTGQIKNLSSLFLNDEGKYQFFDAAYTHVTDQEVFYALQGELKDEYYLKRFKALIGK